jgi:hypothetical protein
MPTSQEAKAQTLRRLIREYIECVVGIVPGDCEALRNAVRSVASLVGGELGRDALRIVESDFEP